MVRMTITAAADGSALGNPGPAGWAWYIDDDHWRAGGWPHGTNNMGELKAVLDLLESTASDADQHLHVLCDSQYVINSVTKWMPGWKRKGWKKKDGKPVLNRDLLEAIDRALVGRSVEFEWVKGHAGHRMNEAADKRANAAATAFSKQQDPQVGPGYRGEIEASGPATLPTPGALSVPAAPSSASHPMSSSARGARTPSAPATSSPAPAEPTDLFSFFDQSGSADAPLDAPEPSTFEEVIGRELLLLRDDVRSDPERAAALLHPDFTEVGASGRTYDRGRILDQLAPVTDTEAVDLVADEVAPGVVLLRYATIGPRGTALRSSLWVRSGGTWLMRYHQGTFAG
jgi:ribonuclease HI